ncbi:MAG TPA: phytoene desaturase family protein [Candidatus Tumulicola sp.]|jgi:phytoene desaturase
MGSGTIRRGRKAVVVGAGVAGLTAAALLARSGYETTVLERSDAPGGRAGRLQRDGFTFDLGPTLLFMPDVFRAAFAACGADFDRSVSLERLSPNYRLHFADGRTLTIGPSLPETIESLERFAPGSSTGLLEYLAGCATAYDLSRRHLVGKRLRGFRDLLSPGGLRALFGSGAFRSLRRTASRAFGSSDVAAALSFQTMYLGMSPYASPELYRLLFFTEMGEGVFFPRGGIFTLVRELERLAANCGATFRYQTPALKVEERDGRASAVVCDGERFSCDIALLTADLPYAYDALLNEPRHRSKRMRHTPSALLLYAAVDGVYPDALHHEFLMPSDLRETCADIFERGRFPRDPAIYLASPSATDASMAPPGSTALYVLVPVANLDGTTDWKQRTGELADRVLESVEGRRFPGLRQRIRWKETRTPQYFLDELNCSRGSAFGLSHDLLQIGPMRPDTRHRRLRNVYFAGASTRPATGLPLVTMSAMQTVERIREEIPA